jgi:hypothetical protein
MCRSAAEGGQRCPSEALKSLDAATTAMYAASNAFIDAKMSNADDVTVERLRTAAADAVWAQDRAEVEYASTPTGRKAIMAKIDKARTNPIRHTLRAKQSVGEWYTTIAKGDLLRAQNKAAATAPRPEPVVLDAATFETEYQPIRRDDQAADRLYFDSNRVRDTEQVKTLWSVQQHPDESLTYHPGIVALPGVWSYITTRKAWTTGHESVTATPDDLWEPEH